MMNLMPTQIRKDSTNEGRCARPEKREIRPRFKIEEFPELYVHQMNNDLRMRFGTDNSENRSSSLLTIGVPEG